MRASARWALAACLLLPAPVVAQAPGDLTAASLEDLMNMQVTLASRKEQRLADTASAITVVTADDIRRSGATTIPDVLRMVPGLQVAQIDSSKWAISVRGFNGRFANKLQVLVDGRSVYTPLFSGVYWDIQDVMLEDIDRIEVIRGPGAAMWGANAVNGVINIITKPANQTYGKLINASAGSSELGQVAVRYGGPIGADGGFRVYGKYFERDEFREGDGRPSADGWNMARGGFRIDRDHTALGSFTVQGDIYDGEIGQTLTPDSLLPLTPVPFAARGSASGGDLLARWTRRTSGRSEVGLQAYYDRSSRDDLVRESRDSFDIDFQHHLELNAGTTWSGASAGA